ncbi:hypothetical protein ACFLZ2_03090 [Candidatus Margulisiibacteriota bacterium]
MRIIFIYLLIFGLMCPACFGEYPIKVQQRGQFEYVYQDDGSYVVYDGKIKKAVGSYAPDMDGAFYFHAYGQISSEAAK